MDKVIRVYAFGTLATGVKTFAWWFNQWPQIYDKPYPVKWIVSALIAGLEYLPLTMAFGAASQYGVHLGLMTAYMEAADNFLRMMQQVGLHDPVGWFDWVAALGLALFVVYQGIMHYYSDRKTVKFTTLPSEETDDEEPLTEGSNGLGNGSVEEGNGGEKLDEIDLSKQSSSESAGGENKLVMGKVYALGLDKERFIIVVIGIIVLGLGSPILALAGGANGQAYVLATLATAAKTFAWWINQYPQLKHLSFLKKWLAGWSIAAIIEYLPLIGSMTIAKEHGVHLGLMTAYMEALDNFFRVLQQRLLNKPLSKHDYIAAAGMFVCVIFQGVMRYLHDHNKGGV